MAQIKDNKIFEQTSFLSGNNTSFIGELYSKYLNDPESVPKSWRDFFNAFSTEREIIKSEIQGPSWAPKKIYKPSITTKIKEEAENKNVFSPVITDQEKEDSVKAIALIRAYRIRGHLIANLDPLGAMERKYLHELHPAGHGFKKEDYNKKIYLGSYMDKGGYGTINEILSFFRKVYCSTVGAEYMHISDPVEKVWFRERLERKENQLSFTTKGKKSILNQLIKAEGFEKFLALKFVGTKRFGIDGGESLIPVSYTHLTLPTNREV